VGPILFVFASLKTFWGKKKYLEETKLTCLFRYLKNKEKRKRKKERKKKACRCPTYFTTLHSEGWKQGWIFTFSVQLSSLAILHININEDVAFTLKEKG